MAGLGNPITDPLQAQRRIAELEHEVDKRNQLLTAVGLLLDAADPDLGEPPEWHDRAREIAELIRGLGGAA